MNTLVKQWLHNSIFFGSLQAIRLKLRPIPRRSVNPWISHLTTIPVQPHVDLDVYWVGPPIGNGPGASLYVHGEELLRFDCLGGNVGHFHINMTQARCCPKGESARLYFPDGTISQHIEHAEFELRRNYEYARRMNRKPRIRSSTIAQDKLDELAGKMKAELDRLNRERDRRP